MATDPTPALRLAMLVLLRASGGPQFQGAAVPVWDGVPPDSVAPPVVVLDEISLSEGQTKDGGPREALIDVAAVIDGRSRADAELLGADLYGRLEGVKPTVTGQTVTALNCIESRTESGGDQGLTHLVRQVWRLRIL
jgi:hypothetical protein